MSYVVRTFKYRLKPSKSQRTQLNRTLDLCRWVFNETLATRKNTWEQEKKTLSLYDTNKQLTLWKRDHPELVSVHSQVLQNVLKRVDRSFQNFFRGFGYPRFQGQNRYNSFTYPQKGFELKDGKLILSKIGNIKIIQHREIEGKIKTCTIKKDIDQWFVSFSCEIDNPAPVNNIKTRTGIDMGLIKLIKLSKGEQVKPPKFFRKSENKLAQEQKRLSRKKKGSGKRNKQRSCDG